jgi:hypothetical protein
MGRELDRQRFERHDFAAYRVGERDLDVEIKVESARRPRFVGSGLSAAPPLFTANMSASNFGSCVVPTSVSALTMYGV